MLSQMEPSPPTELKPSAASPRTDALKLDEAAGGAAEAPEEEKGLGPLLSAALALPEDASDISSYEEARTHLQSARRTLKLLHTAIDRMSNGRLTDILASSHFASAPEPAAAIAEAAGGNDYDSQCTDAVLSTIRRATQSIYIGVDGSDNCAVALDVALSLRKGEDEMHLV